MKRGSILVGLFLATGLSLNAQVGPAAKSAGGGHLSAGGEFSVFQIDAASHPVEYGVGAYADYNFLSFLGIEVEGRSIQFHEKQDLRRDSISGGIRYIYNYGRFAPYAKALAGLGSGDFPRGTYLSSCCSPNYYRQHDTFTTLTLGAGVDYKLTSRIAIRGEYEYQYWLNYGGGPNKKLGTSNPNGYSFGASYRFF